MNKKFLTKAILSIIFFAAVLILWILSVTISDNMGNLNLSWLIAVYSSLVALFVLLPVVPMAKLSKIIVRAIFIIAIVFVVSAILALVGMLIKDNFVLPLIAIIMAAVALPCGIVLDAILHKIKDSPEDGHTEEESSGEQTIDGE